MARYQLRSQQETYGKTIKKIFNGKWFTLMFFVDKSFYLCYNGGCGAKAFEDTTPIDKRCVDYLYVSNIISIFFVKPYGKDIVWNKYYKYELTEAGQYLLDNGYVTLEELLGLYLKYHLDALKYTRCGRKVRNCLDALKDGDFVDFINVLKYGTRQHEIDDEADFGYESDCEF